MPRQGYLVVLLLGLGCVSPGSSGPAVEDSGAPGLDLGGPGNDLAVGDIPAAVDSAPDAVLVADSGADVAPDSSSGETAFDTGSGLAERRQLVCARWVADRADRAEGTFSGSVAQCMPGDVSAPGRTNALKLLNMYRFIADLDPVSGDPALDAKAQSCAIMMEANGMLNHMPPATWKCFTAEGAEAASKSNIASTSMVAAIDLYMNDFGNDTTIGHRRWLLSNSLGPVGFGSASKGSCAWVVGGKGRAAKPWRAWPAPGPFPFEAMSAGGFGQTIDATGWSLQSDTIDLTAATVTVTDGAQALPVTTSQLTTGVGSRYAIRWVATGWKSAVGHTYHVQIGGTPTSIAYDVEMVACP
jgi:hypothetical protein